MVDFSLRTLLARRDLSSDGKIAVLALDRGKNHPILVNDLAAACGFTYDHTCKVVRELHRAGLVESGKGKMSFSDVYVSITTDDPWIGVLARTAGAAVVATPPQTFNAADQTPSASTDDEDTVEAKTVKKTPRGAQKGQNT